jgi:UDPglucose--hexose-1-phosphate uridylyltransferase
MRPKAMEPTAPAPPRTMSELRWNPQLGEWVITATHRQERTFLPPVADCPLCPTQPGGPETEIPRSTFEIVVFENRFPSLSPHPPEPTVPGSDLTPVRPAVGACEVVVYTPDHSASIADASLEQLTRLVAVWAQRTRELADEEGIRYVFVFENRGEAIGVTLHHPHGQIYAYPYLPPLIARELERGRARRAEHGSCLWCDLLAQETPDARRTVLDGDLWRLGVPFFARWPYELHLVSRRHLGWLHELTPEEVAELARMLRGIVRKYDGLFSRPLPYVMAIHQRPPDPDAADAYHLHLEFYPPNRDADRLKYLAGSEAGAGAFINDTVPEETAARLRDVPPLTLDEA